MSTSAKVIRRSKIKMRVKNSLVSSSERPRMSVSRSNKEISVQIIDDINGTTIVSASSLDKEFVKEKGNKIEQAKMVGKLIAERAVKAGISKVVFDRNGFLYHGRIKSLAESAREAGLNF